LRAYCFAVALGICAAVINLELADPLLTALSVLAFTMLLGFILAQRPYVVAHQRQPRAQVYKSFLGFVTAAAGAHGGSVGRRLIAQLWPEMKSGPQLHSKGHG
jgi:hypothetical protein